MNSVLRCALIGMMLTSLRRFFIPQKKEQQKRCFDVWKPLVIFFKKENQKVKYGQSSDFLTMA
jgi:hypothetical protein